ILQCILENKHFKEYPNSKKKGYYDYYEVIKQPICLDEIKRKFVEKEYTQLSEFVYDVRLLLLNCYRFFGPNAIETRRALRLEETFERKLASLSDEQRELCSLEATHGKLENVTETEPPAEDESKHQFESKLLESVEGEKATRLLERKQKLEEEIRSEKEGVEKDILTWEKDVLFTEEEYKMMKYMWEIPVIGHFISLSVYQLNIEIMPMYEIERMFLMPQASKGLARLMTTLLSTPLTRLKIHTKPSMPYKIWNKKLTLKVSGWFKIYNKSNNDPQVVFEKLGIEHQFWKIFGNSNPLEEYEFHQLTFHQRVFLVKTLCDYILQNHKLIRDTISEITEEFYILLGEDRSGSKYMYFPQFLNQDIRVYKQCIDPKTWIERDREHHTEALKTGKNLKVNQKKKRHKRRAWMLGKITKRVSPKKNDGGKLKKIVETKEKCLETGEVNHGTTESRADCDPTKIKITLNLKSVNDTVNDSLDKVKLVIVKDKDEYKMKSCEEIKSETENKERKVLYSAVWLEPNPEDFELVADSVEGLRRLLEKLCDDDVELIKKLVNSNLK
ncbi:hypothetical protein L9F63_024558, partial [Diploptera punctata]